MFFNCLRWWFENSLNISFQSPPRSIKCNSLKSLKWHLYNLAYQVFIAHPITNILCDHCAQFRELIKNYSNWHLKWQRQGKQQKFFISSFLYIEMFERNILWHFKYNFIYKASHKRFIQFSKKNILWALKSIIIVGNKIKFSSQKQIQTHLIRKNMFLFLCMKDLLHIIEKKCYGHEILLILQRICKVYYLYWHLATIGMKFVTGYIN